MEITTISITKHKASRIHKDLWVKIFPRVIIPTSQTIVAENKTKDKTQFYSETNPQHNIYQYYALPFKQKTNDKTNALKRNNTRISLKKLGRNEDKIKGNK